MEIALQGKKIRSERTIKIWREMYKMHTDAKNPKTLEEIANCFLKPNGMPYSRQGVYKALRRLKEISL